MNDSNYKKSIRFFNDRMVRAVWDEKGAKWLFSAIDIVSAINGEDDYVKAGNYWRWLKKKLNGNGEEVVSVTHDFKFEAPDGKMRLADTLDDNAVKALARHYPNNRANKLIDKNEYLEAMRRSIVDSEPIKRLLKDALTDKINDRVTFMKGIDYSYYYEQQN